MQYLGISEQEPALPFVRLVSPTDIQEVGWKMGGIIADKHTWDWLNPAMWRIVGFESGNVIKFLKQYILIARQWQISLTPENKEQFKEYFVAQYEYRPDDLDELFDAFFQVRDAGLMPDTIYAPWTYESTTLAQDIGKAAGEAVKSVFPKALLFGVLGIAAYAFFSRGIPKMTLEKI